MPFVAMNDYVDGIEDLKVAMGYGLPDSYPLGLNGLGGPAECEKLLNDPDISSRAYKAAGCTDVSYTETGQSINQYSTALGPSVKSRKDRTAKINDVFSSFASVLVPFLQNTGQPKQNIIYQKQPDYTTYAVIGGAVIVASVLAIAVGKSGRGRSRNEPA